MILNMSSHQCTNRHDKFLLYLNIKFYSILFSFIKQNTTFFTSLHIQAGCNSTIEGVTLKTHSSIENHTHTHTHNQPNNYSLSILSPIKPFNFIWSPISSSFSIYTYSSPWNPEIKSKPNSFSWKIFSLFPSHHSLSIWVTTTVIVLY